MDVSIPGCLGFTIERQRKTRDGGWGEVEVLRNRVGFSDHESGNGERPEVFSEKSNKCPFQRYDWTDHGANNGETVRYLIAAVRLPDGGKPGEAELEPIADSGWTDDIIVDAYCGEGVSAFFNRGFVMSQYVARVARKNNWGPRDIKERTKELEEPLRRFLSGELRTALLRLIDEAIENTELELYAALYELSDRELLNSLKLLRGRAHVVLANGSDKEGDGNEGSRDELLGARVDVRDRLLYGKGLGHNKFVVLARAEKAFKAWTGSTNWAPTGLCTQVNNGILIENVEVAATYLEQWNRLAEACGDFPKELVEANGQSPRKCGKIEVWVTRIKNSEKKNGGLGADLNELIELVKSANEAVLYVMFQPGDEPLSTILSLAPEKYVRGVVSTVTKSNIEKFALKGIDKDSKEYKTALVQPEGIVKDFSTWIKEVTRAQFLYPYNAPAVGHAITHSKMIVIDPFSDNCEVITGSHNFSQSASEKNDDNFVVIKGNRRLAEAYAVACLATYSHYRWRAYVKDKTDAKENVWSKLSKNPAWQAEYLTAERKKHLSLWCR